ncbi:MAG: cell division protein FtsX [Thermaceae bacterium]
MYALTQALKQLLRHPTSSLATFSTALLSFFLLHLMGLILWNLGRVVDTLEGSLEVAAFLEEGANTEAILSEVQTWPEVKSVRLVSKEEALAELILDYPYLAEAKELVENPLPNTLRLTLNEPQAVREVAQRLKTLQGVEGVEYGGGLTERLLKILGGFRMGLGVLAVLLLLNTLFSVMSTIRLSVESRKEAIAIMLLVGAKRLFIQAPFIWEGLLLSLSAALLATSFSTLAYRFLAQSLQSLLPFLPVLSQNDVLRLSLGLLLLSFFLGAGGAFFASRAHMAFDRGG